VSSTVLRNSRKKNDKILDLREISRIRRKRSHLWAMFTMKYTAGTSDSPGRTTYSA
jgi:hypothetical protein